MQSRRCCRVVPGERSVHYAVIGDRQVLESQFVGTGDVLVDAANPVQQRKLRMQMQMRKLGHAHVLSGNTCAVRLVNGCLLYTSDAADDLTRVDLGGRRIIKKKK